MKQILIEVDEATLERLEHVAPARSRRRSAFIRAAIQKAIADELERSTEAAYRKVPDSAADAWFDPATWEAGPVRKPGKRKRR